MTSRRFAAAAAAAATILVAALVWFLARPEVVAVPPPGPGDAQTRRDAAADDLVEGLQRAWESPSRTRAVALTTPSARALAGEVWDNVRALGLTDLDLALVDVALAPGDGHWRARVDLSYRLPGVDPGRTDLTTSLDVKLTRSGGARLVGTGVPGARSPLWLLEPLTVRRAGRVVVLDGAGPDQATTLLQQGERALAHVARVLPGWRGTLVLEAPRLTDDLGLMLAADEARYENVAALTTTVDGSAGRTAPTHVMVNPGVFDGLRADGAQVVISHEATHVATGAATAAVPVWLLEGFADFVALDGTRLPDSVTASQILGRVQREGPPEHLPDKEDFDPTSDAFGSSYEAAWLACRLIARDHGIGALVRLYRSVDAGEGIRQAFGDLGTTPAAFTQQWRDYLRTLARKDAA